MFGTPGPGHVKLKWGGMLLLSLCACVTLYVLLSRQTNLQAAASCRSVAHNVMPFWQQALSLLHMGYCPSKTLV